MKVNFDPSVVTAFARSIVHQLREKRLWPLAVGLLVAIVAVPVALSKSSSARPLAASAQSTPPPSAATSLPAVSVQSTPGQSHLSGKGRNPFGGGASTTTSAGSASTTTTSSAGTGGGGTSGGGTSGGSTSSSSFSGGSATTPTTTIPSITKNSAPKPAPAGLSATQSYDVALAITNPSGGLDTVDPLERLSLIPSEQQPLLVDLGVLQGGKRVLFVVQQGTVVSGPGTCTPGPIDCEILSLAPGQTEQLSIQSGTGVTPVALFAVTAITAEDHSSAAAADQARKAVSAAGRKLLSGSPLTALALFQYEPSAGAVVDLRNLTGNVSSLSKSIVDHGPNGQPVSTSATQAGGGSGGSVGGGGASSIPVLQVRLLLMPEGLPAVLRSGIALRVSSNEAATGFASVLISRSAAKLAHIKAGRGPSVVIGRGTVSKIMAGTVSLRLRLSKSVVAKLRPLKHVKLTVSLSLVGAGGSQLATDVAGNY